MKKDLFGDLTEGWNSERWRAFPTHGAEGAQLERWVRETVRDEDSKS